MKKKYWLAALAGMALGMGGCAYQESKGISATYPIEGISVYKGQSAAELFNDNGAPNVVKNLDNGAVMWVYYTNFRPVGGGEIISYDNPTPGSAGTSCNVKVMLVDGKVAQALSDCR